MILVAEGWKRCSRCRVFKPNGQFGVREYGPDGWPRRRQSACSPCVRRRARQLHAQKLKREGRRMRRKPTDLSKLTPEQLLEHRRQIRRESTARVKAERGDEWRVKKRMEAKLKRDRERGAAPRPYPLRAQLAGAPVTDPYIPPSRYEVVPSGPLRQFLLSKFPGWNSNEIALIASGSVSAKVIYNILHSKRDEIELDAADRLLTYGLGRPELLNTLYPLEAP